jgi:hypothetical protein
MIAWTSSSSASRRVRSAFFYAASKVRRRTKGEVAQEDLVDPEGDLTGEEVADVLGMRLAGSARPLAELLEIQDKLTEKEKLAVLYVEQMGMIGLGYPRGDLCPGAPPPS